MGVKPGVLSCTVMAERAELPASSLAKPQHQYVAQSTEQPLEKDKTRACDTSSPRDDSRELPQEPLSCTGLLPPCCPGFSLCLNMAWEVFCIVFMFSLLPQRNRALGALPLSPHLAGGSIGTCARRRGTCCSLGLLGRGFLTYEWHRCVWEWHREKLLCVPVSWLLGPAPALQLPLPSISCCSQATGSAPEA